MSCHWLYPLSRMIRSADLLAKLNVVQCYQKEVQCYDPSPHRERELKKKVQKKKTELENIFLKWSLETWPSGRAEAVFRHRT